MIYMTTEDQILNSLRKKVASEMLAVLLLVRPRIMDEGTAEEWAAINSAINKAYEAGIV